eukprot:gene7816-10618_t
MLGFNIFGKNNAASNNGSQINNTPNFSNHSHQQPQINATTIFGNNNTNQNFSQSMFNNQNSSTNSGFNTNANPFGNSNGRVQHVTSKNVNNSFKSITSPNNDPFNQNTTSGLGIFSNNNNNNMSSNNNFHKSNSFANDGKPKHTFNPKINSNNLNNAVNIFNNNIDNSNPFEQNNDFKVKSQNNFNNKPNQKPNFPNKMNSYAHVNSNQNHMQHRTTPNNDDYNDHDGMNYGNDFDDSTMSNSSPFKSASFYNDKSKSNSIGGTFGKPSSKPYAGGHLSGKPQPTCRVCNSIFGSREELKIHLKAENHYELPDNGQQIQPQALQSQAPPLFSGPNAMNSNNAKYPYSKGSPPSNQAKQSFHTKKVTHFDNNSSATNFKINANNINADDYTDDDDLHGSSKLSFAMHTNQQVTDDTSSSFNPSDHFSNKSIINKQKIQKGPHQSAADQHFQNKQLSTGANPATGPNSLKSNKNQILQLRISNANTSAPSKMGNLTSINEVNNKAVSKRNGGNIKTLANSIPLKDSHFIPQPLIIEADSEDNDDVNDEDDPNFAIRNKPVITHKNSDDDVVMPISNIKNSYQNKTVSQVPMKAPLSIGSYAFERKNSYKSASDTDTDNNMVNTQSSGIEDNEDNQGISLCEDMCPEEERIKRLKENDIHKLELPSNVMIIRSDGVIIKAEGYQDTMIKKFQRSSADHVLQIPKLIRTPRALLQTIRYIEDNIMEKPYEGFDARLGEVPTLLTIYLFVWDRFRMISKDFTLQLSNAALTVVWVECHERMVRWFILMDHHMRGDPDFITGHAQQNAERLNDFLKTLQDLYFRSGKHLPTPNKAEFISYFVIIQLGNRGEVSKFLQKLSNEVLNSPELRFALEVWGALKTENYAKFFRLLREATLLQACLMFRYVGEVRLQAIKKIVKTHHQKGTPPTRYPLSDIINLLMFESEEDALEFIQHCGFQMEEFIHHHNNDNKNHEDGDAHMELFIIFRRDDNVDDMLPRDKNDKPILPNTNCLKYWIDELKSISPIDEHIYSTAEICRGSSSTHAALFDDLKYIYPNNSSNIIDNKHNKTIQNNDIQINIDMTKMEREKTLKEALKAKKLPIKSIITSPAIIPTPSFPAQPSPSSTKKLHLLSGALGSTRSNKPPTPPSVPTDFDINVIPPKDETKKNAKIFDDPPSANIIINPSVVPLTSQNNNSKTDINNVQTIKKSEFQFQLPKNPLSSSISPSFTTVGLRPLVAPLQNPNPSDYGNLFGQPNNNHSPIKASPSAMLSISSPELSKKITAINTDFSLKSAQDNNDNDKKQSTESLRFSFDETVGSIGHPTNILDNSLMSPAIHHQKNLLQRYKSIKPTSGSGNDGFNHSISGSYDNVSESPIITPMISRTATPVITNMSSSSREIYELSNQEKEDHIFRQGKFLSRSQSLIQEKSNTPHYINALFGVVSNSTSYDHDNINNNSYNPSLSKSPEGMEIIMKTNLKLFKKKLLYNQRKRILKMIIKGWIEFTKSIVNDNNNKIKAVLFKQWHRIYHRKINNKNKSMNEMMKINFNNNNNDNNNNRSFGSVISNKRKRSQQYNNNKPLILLSKVHQLIYSSNHIIFDDESIINNLSKSLSTKQNSFIRSLHIPNHLFNNNNNKFEINNKIYFKIAINSICNVPAGLWDNDQNNNNNGILVSNMFRMLLSNNKGLMSNYYYKLYKNNNDFESNVDEELYKRHLIKYNQNNQRIGLVQTKYDVKNANNYNYNDNINISIVDVTNNHNNMSDKNNNQLLTSTQAALIIISNDDINLKSNSNNNGALQMLSNCLSMKIPFVLVVTNHNYSDYTEGNNNNNNSQGRIKNELLYENIELNELHLCILDKNTSNNYNSNNSNNTTNNTSHHKSSLLFIAAKTIKQLLKDFILHSKDLTPLDGSLDNHSNGIASEIINLMIGCFVISLNNNNNNVDIYDDIIDHDEYDYFDQLFIKLNSSYNQELLKICKLCLKESILLLSHHITPHPIIHHVVTREWLESALMTDSINYYQKHNMHYPPNDFDTCDNDNNNDNSNDEDVKQLIVVMNIIQELKLPTENKIKSTIYKQIFDFMNNLSNNNNENNLTEILQILFEKINHILYHIIGEKLRNSLDGIEGNLFDNNNADKQISSIHIVFHSSNNNNNNNDNNNNINNKLIRTGSTILINGIYQNLRHANNNNNNNEKYISPYSHVNEDRYNSNIRMKRQLHNDNNNENDDGNINYDSNNNNNNNNNVDILFDKIVKRSKQYDHNEVIDYISLFQIPNDTVDNNNNNNNEEEKLKNIIIEEKESNNKFHIFLENALLADSNSTSMLYNSMNPGNSNDMKTQSNSMNINNNHMAFIEQCKRERIEFSNKWNC